MVQLTKSRVALLHGYLESVYHQYHRSELLGTDPLVVALDASEPAERELRGLVAGWFASGRASSIIDGANKAISKLTRDGEDQLIDVVRGCSAQELAVLLTGVRYRWVDAPVLAASLAVIGAELKADPKASTVALLTGRVQPTDETVLPGLVQTISRLEEAALTELNAMGAQDNQRRALRWLWSNPSRGGAAKRWMMWLRWFVRNDAIDPGGHEVLGAHRLIMPLDVHVFRLVRYMKLTRYKAASGRAALDVTRSFRVIEPRDPLRYDFALSRIGILGHCPGKREVKTCASCALYTVCRA